MPKQEVMHPRLVEKLKDLEHRGLLTTAKAYVAPQDRTEKKM